MNLSSYRLTSALLAAFACLLLTPRAHAVGQARADFPNISSAQLASQQRNPGVTGFNGYIKGTTQTQTPNTVVLQECAFGQAFSQWFPSATYARDILGEAGVSGVKGALYPATGPGTTRTELQDGTPQNPKKPFRYKWLLYSGTGTDVTAFDATSVAGWFTNTDRQNIYDQIAILKAAVAASPLDTSLRDALLDVYYDLAVAEMQAAKPKLATLAKYHLGLLPLGPNEFIIDKEIATYDDIVDTMDAAIDQYTALLRDRFPDIDPASIDSSVPAFGRVGMGRYLFIREQPRRNSTPSQYANESGVQEVPQMVDGQIVTTGILFTSYKDLDMWLKIIGQRQQHLASAARLRGTRRGQGDVAAARQALNQAISADDSALELFKFWFPAIFPPEGRTLTAQQGTDLNRLLTESGLLASLSAIDSGRIEMAGVTGFLNGSANVLGYDPEFLLLVQDQTNAVPPLESYDTLRNMIKEAATNSNKPLNVALTKLGTEVPPTGAKGLYLTFAEKVDRTAQDIDDADGALADRYFAITGYGPTDPAFKLENPNPTAGSELGEVLATIVALDAEALARKALTAELETQFKVGADGVISGAAVESVNAAAAKKDALAAAAQQYRSSTGGLYSEMIGVSAGAAAMQATYDSVSATAGIAATASGGSNPVGWAVGGAAANAVLFTGAANVAMQTAAVTITGQNERDIDYAGIDFTIATSSAEVALTVNQARQDLSALKREQIANKLEILAGTSARTQAEAQRAALLAELARIVKNRDDALVAIRKKSYADPLHYHRAEYAVIDADESFRNAQRWMFYAIQALNYKWHGKFAGTSHLTGKSYDTSSVFKVRNAQELDDLLTAMVDWDETRVSETLNSLRIVTVISFRDHILSRNPRRFYTDSELKKDPGTRADNTVSTLPLPTVETVEYFRNVLTTKYTEAGTGDLVIPFSTVFRNEAPDRVDGSFFRGATYNTAGSVTSPGFWREKIEYVKVKILAKSGSSNALVGGAINYGGTTYFHTRVPPRGNRSVTGLLPGDAPGEFLVAPFRYWETQNFNQDFKPSSTHLVTSENIPYTATPTVITYDGPGNGFDNAGPPVRAFAGRSIAATGWVLRIERVTGTTILDVNNIEDIEFIIAYKHSIRANPPP